jgi:hypothetical protein
VLVMLPVGLVAATVPAAAATATAGLRPLGCKGGMMSPWRKLVGEGTGEKARAPRSGLQAAAAVLDGEADEASDPSPSPAWKRGLRRTEPAANPMVAGTALAIPVDRRGFGGRCALGDVSGA